MGEIWKYWLYGLAAPLILVTAGGAAAAEKGGNACFESLAECPVIGCADPDSPNALVNALKHHMPSRGNPVKLSIEDFATLQDRAGSALGEKAEKTDLDKSDRKKLIGLRLSRNRKVSEGDLVRLLGYVVGLPNRPKASGRESVNCRLSGVANNDFHIPIGPDPDSTEFDGVVVEMIPQARNPGWTVAKLRRVARDHRPVIVEGQLFYDNKHRVNDDPDNVLGGEPKRLSLWEIHPIKAFYVCMAANKKCRSENVKTQQWMRLEQIKK